MNIQGTTLYDVNTQIHLDFFQEMYDTTPHQMMEDYDTNRVTMITSDDLKYIVFIEPDLEFVNMVFTLDKRNDCVFVFAQEGLDDEGVFNTDGIAFMRVESEKHKPKLYVIENSPYDVSEEDFEDYDVDVAILLKSIGNDATFENTKFVAQL